MDDRWFGSVITVVIRLRQLDEFADNSCLECQLPGFEYFMAFRLDWIAIAGATKKWSRETAAGRRLAAVESAQKKSPILTCEQINFMTWNMEGSLTRHRSTTTRCSGTTNGEVDPDPIHLVEDRW